MNKPNYIAIAAITLDGKIARDKNHLSTDWTSPEDKTFFRSMLKQCDVVLIGNNTYQTAKEPLSKRNCIVLTSKVTEPKQENERLVFINTEHANLGEYVAGKNYQTVAILGGAQTYAYCLENNLLDELYLTIEPVVFGAGINLFEGKKTLDKNFQLISVEKLNQAGTILLHYKKA